MKHRYWFFAILSLSVMVGCSNENGYAKKAILKMVNSSSAVRFGEFIPLDDKTACYEIHVKNYLGHEQLSYVLLRKNTPEDQVWDNLVVTDSLEACRAAGNAAKPGK